MLSQNGEISQMHKDDKEGCPYLTDRDIDSIIYKAMERTSDEFMKKFMSRFREEVLPELKKELFADFQIKMYASVGKETLSLGKKVLVRITWMVGALIIVIGSYFGFKP